MELIEDTLLRPSQVRRMTGHSRGFLYKLDEEGILPAIRINPGNKHGGDRRWRLSDIEKYMNGEKEL